MGTGGAHRRRQESGDGGAREQRERTTTSGGIVSPYELLGLSPDADEREIHRAFQRLAIHYHPDKVYHLGEEFRRVAHQKFTELKDAYETLLRRRGRRE
jgi:DnaJ like chaperone protein